MFIFLFSDRNEFNFVVYFKLCCMHDKDLDAEEIEECREAFNLFDSDADGHPNHQATSIPQPWLHARTVKRTVHEHAWKYTQNEIDCTGILDAKELKAGIRALGFHVKSSQVLSQAVLWVFVDVHGSRHWQDTWIVWLINWFCARKTNTCGYNFSCFLDCIAVKISAKRGCGHSQFWWVYYNSGTKS